MFIREITALVIAALLLTGGVATASQVTEYGAQPAEELKITLTQEEARAIALDHAGLTEAEVKWERSEHEMERGVPEWDIDFRSGDWEYDYEIQAETGAVIKSEKEYDPVKVPASTKPAETQPPKTEPPKTEQPKAETPKKETSKTEKLTADQAKNVALNHAGLKASQVKGLRAEYDVDDGIPEWDVEFYADGFEYDYEIHAESGKIRSWDKERDD